MTTARVGIPPAYLEQWMHSLRVAPGRFPKPEDLSAATTAFLEVVGTDFPPGQ